MAISHLNSLELCHILSFTPKSVSGSAITVETRVLPYDSGSFFWIRIRFCFYVRVSIHKFSDLVQCCFGNGFEFTLNGGRVVGVHQARPVGIVDDAQPRDELEVPFERPQGLAHKKGEKSNHGQPAEDGGELGASDHAQDDA